MEQPKHVQPHSPELSTLLDINKVTPVDAGHMMYHKCIVDTADGNQYFVKTSDDSLLTDDNEAKKMWEYLIKEQCAYDIVGRHGYSNVPNARLRNRSLILEAMGEQDGWCWEVPDGEHTTHYINDVLSALVELSKIPAANDFNTIMGETSPVLMLRKGWNQLDQSTANATAQRAKLFMPQLHRHIYGGLGLINDILYSTNTRTQITQSMADYANTPTNFIGHFDARQANIGWHPQKGVKIVDWSWASPGLEKSDTTMFLIDLHKSGIDVTQYMDQHFDPDHALLLIGYWLAKSGTDSYSGDLTVRFHQFASAVAAASLLSKT